MKLHLALSTENEATLPKQAAAAGQDVETFVLDSVRAELAGNVRSKVYIKVVGGLVALFLVSGIAARIIQRKIDSASVRKSESQYLVRSFEGLLYEGKIAFDSVAVTPDGRSIAAGGYGRVILWNADTGQEIRTLQPEGSNDLQSGVWHINSLAFRPDGSQIAAAGDKFTVYVWETTTGLQVRALSGETHRVAYSPDGIRLATGVGQIGVQIWDATNGEKLQTLIGPPDISGLVFSPDGKHIASADSNVLTGTVKLWEVSSGKEVRTFEGHACPVNWITFSPDGQRLAAATGYTFSSSPDSNEITIWNTAAGEKTLQLRGHKDPVTCVAFAPHGNLLASSGGGTIKLWDMSSGREVKTIRSHSFITGIAFSPDGGRLVASGNTGVNLWDPAR